MRYETSYTDCLEILRDPTDGFAQPRMNMQKEVSHRWLRPTTDENMSMNLAHQKLTYQLRGGLFYVQNEVGPGQSEEIYHKAFIKWLEEQGIPYQSKAKHPLSYKSEIVMDLYPDFVINQTVTIELKSKPCSLQPGHRAQLFNYLKLRSDDVGILVNMGLDRVVIERYLYERPEYEITEDWSHWEGNDHTKLSRIRKIFSTLFQQHQTGYSGEITDRLLAYAFKKYDLSVHHKPNTEAYYKGLSLGRGPLDCQVINQELVFCHTSLFETNDFNRSRVQSHMKVLGLPYGLAVNFGKKTMEIQAYAL